MEYGYSPGYIDKFEGAYCRAAKFSQDNVRVMLEKSA
jgi:hypothetical protein